MIRLQPKPIGPTVTTSRPAHLPAGSPADGTGNHSQDLTTEQASEADADPILCHHCGRTANNGISCEGSCVADSGY
jgi:hypothetical protein